MWVHVNNKTKYISLLGEGPTQELDDRKLNSPNFIVSREKIMFNLLFYWSKQLFIC